MASQTRAVFAHGTFTPGSGTRTSMDYITIASQGDAIDFGDKSETREYADGGCSDSHGGLGGF
jgi:DNA integrity scanning protein DisA with diadenylate cyclase activity